MTLVGRACQTERCEFTEPIMRVVKWIKLINKTLGRYFRLQTEIVSANVHLLQKIPKHIYIAGHLRSIAQAFLALHICTFFLAHHSCFMACNFTLLNPFHCSQGVGSEHRRAFNSKRIRYLWAARHLHNSKWMLMLHLICWLGK